MGSFTSTTSYNNGDHEDDDIILQDTVEGDDLLKLFETETTVDTRLKLQRAFLRANSETSSHSNLRVMQWNVLSQTLGQNCDKFAFTPEHALEWKFRRFYILNEIIAYKPDVVCLQEVDHFEFLHKTLATQGYNGLFHPKPDSPCIYVKNNNGPDGCAIFYKKNRFEALKSKKTILPVWTISSNQVAISILLRDTRTNQTVYVITTHLKARSGALMSAIRKEQGRALLDFVKSYSGGNIPTVICGDFNAEPHEPVHDVLRQSWLDLGSAYAAFDGCEPPYTSWKIREDGEQCQTLDYIFYTKNQFDVDSLLKLPRGCDIGEHRLPSIVYPSDHFSLVCDLSFK